MLEEISLSITIQVLRIHTLFMSNTFMNTARLKLTKNQANTKQHPEAELLGL